MAVGAQLGGGRLIVMLGGVDVANEPALDYGIWRSKWKGALLAYALRRADAVFAVDDSLRVTLESSSGQSWPKVQALPTGYDPQEWTPDPNGAARQRMVLSVAACNSPERARLKGVDLLVEAARRMPDVPFLVIGVDSAAQAAFAGMLPPNIELLHRIPRPDLLAHYRKARVYAQPSRREGLPNALCEAMLCGCVPVGTDIGGIPTAIGAAGHIVAAADVEALVRAIGAALDAPQSAGDAARARIADNFPRERRERTLVRTIRRLGGAEALQ
jgi:glycosyltransferase involved in cell wall biosynthesis